MLRVCGDRGSAEVYGDRAILRPHQRKETVFASRRDSFALEFQHFAEVVRKGIPLAVKPEDALADLELMEALCKMKA